ncbi:hypothetical protein BC835DRAFT_635784 [Cytidiella melzeri]|nr:hypothetical protein BC835DRAFT_635784 [Cytidiella melzeri]
MICALHCVSRRPPTNNAFSSADGFDFRCEFYTYGEHDRTTPTHVTMVEVLSLTSPSRHGATTTSTAYSGMYPWGLLDSLQGFVRLRFVFHMRDDLVQYVEAYRTALAKLQDRIDLLYEDYDIERHMVDFVTLEDREQKLTAQETSSEPQLGRLSEGRICECEAIARGVGANGAT